MSKKYDLHLLEIHKLTERAEKAEVELVEAVKDKVKAESEVRRLRERIRKLWGERSEEETHCAQCDELEAMIPQGSFCAECGTIGNRVDEDGLCPSCGNDAMLYGWDWADLIHYLMLCAAKERDHLRRLLKTMGVSPLFPKAR